MMDKINSYIKEYGFLFKQLVKRDFKNRYKGTVLGIIWSILYPLIDFLILFVVFSKLLGRNTPHYPVYIFCGTLIMAYFRESTREGMRAFLYNSNIITKIKLPKSIFILSKSFSSLFNLILTTIVFFIICLIDGISFKLSLILLVYPIICITLFNIGLEFMLSVSYVFFRDTAYIYDLFLVIINYLSATFYSIKSFSIEIQRLFLLNPIYCYIEYFREIVINNRVPSVLLHVLCLIYALIALFIGVRVYKANSKKFIYYL